MEPSLSQTLKASTDGPSKDAQDPYAEIVRLREELAIEQRRSKSLTVELKKNREAIVTNAMVAEAEEECITNKLTKKLNDLIAEKARLMLEVEREEELISNTLQKQLTQLRKDKVDLENELEQEQECMVNKLQRQLEVLSKEKLDLESSRADQAAQIQGFLRQCQLELEICEESFSPAYAQRYYDALKVVSSKMSQKLS